MDIEFCEGCDGSISRHEIEAGEIVRHGGRMYHRACVPTIVQRSARSLPFWLPWLLLAPALAVGLLLGVLLAAGDPSAAPGGGDGSAARLESVESQLRGLSAQVEATGREIRTAMGALGEGGAARDATMREFATDLDLLVEALEKLATRPVPAATASGRIADEDRLRRLLADVASDDSDRRFGALRELFLYRPEPRAIEAIRGRLEDPDADIRSYAARLLGEIGDRVSAGTLITLLRDDSHLVRLSAHRALQLLSGMPFEFDPIGRVEDRQEQAAEWERWWHEQENGDGDGD